MPDDVVYSSAASLRSKRTFLAATRAEVRLVPSAAWPLFVRGLQAQYRQSHLRWAWVILPGLATTGVWVYLTHAGVVSFGTTKIPYVVYVLAGTVLWQLFFDCVNAPLVKLGAARTSLTKSRLPHEAYIVAGVLEALFNFLVRSVVFAIVFVVAGMSVSSTLLLVPVGLIALMILGLAIGLLLTPAGLLYHDVSQGLTLAGMFWLYLTPVVYPPPAHGVGALLVRLNPVTPVLVSTRAWATASGGALPGQFAVVLCASLIVLAVSWIAYRVARPHLVARL